MSEHSEPRKNHMPMRCILCEQDTHQFAIHIESTDFLPVERMLQAAREHVCKKKSFCMEDRQTMLYTGTIFCAGSKNVERWTQYAAYLSLPSRIEPMDVCRPMKSLSRYLAKDLPQVEYDDLPCPTCGQSCLLTDIRCSGCESWLMDYAEQLPERPTEVEFSALTRAAWRGLIYAWERSFLMSTLYSVLGSMVVPELAQGQHHAVAAHLTWQHIEDLHVLVISCEEYSDAIDDDVYAKIMEYARLYALADHGPIDVDKDGARSAIDGLLGVLGIEFRQRDR